MRDKPIANAVYLDYQATTPIDERVLAEMNPYLGSCFGNPHSKDHSFGWCAAQAVEKALAQIAEFIGADPDEVIFTSGATEANNLALLGVARRMTGNSRRRILMSSIEHRSVLALKSVLEHQLNYKVEILPVDSEGHVVVPELENAMGHDVLLVSVMAVNNEIGTIQNIRRISAIVQEFGAVFHCDAVQAPLAMAMDGIADYVDLLSLSAHKLYGPKGIGALFARRDLHNQIEPIIYGGRQQNNLRSGTIPVPLCVGMGAAITLLDNHNSRLERDGLKRKRDKFVQGLIALDWPISLNGPHNNRHPGNANVCFRGLSAHDILAVVQPRIAASTGSACSSGMPESSHVLRAIGLPEVDAQSSIRFSVGRSTTDAELEIALEIINEAIERLASTKLYLGKRLDS